ncbi:cupin domain-containing protein [Chroococcidiopsis sp. FACHB-1243]|uniref:cupin domain-containing protein n=1 Tax=Chroococcidiopsis sp. [FACHB-1243] TaxID=2692781 RepID=UPI001786AD1E|nr:cupin domain-containing protein [Chroococcidiopsis sp. [FACHB-1243]]MBD2309877.1 cupin domain-containing protein [Chroococcidiopsis sp. [FACHB-1243]]
MTAFDCEVQQGENFTVANIGKLLQLHRFSFQLPSRAIEVEGKLFIKQILDLTSCEISFNKLPAKVAIPFYHKHKQNEEVYLFLQGKGEFQIDDEIFPISEGTVVRVDPDGERTLRSVSDEDLVYIVIQSRANSYEGHTILDGVAIDKKVSWLNSD